ncbi:MAG: hypothetical protein ACJ79M_04540 [Myxococcales bacterium]
MPFLAVALLCAAAEAPSRAPLGTRTQGPLRELFLDVTSADARACDSSELEVRYSMANTWNEPMSVMHGPSIDSQMMDEQADSIAVRYRAPWSRFFGARFAPFSTSIEGRFTVHWGGYTDRAIESWHGLVGAFNYERTMFPRNEVHLAFGDEGGTAFRIEHTTATVGDIVLRNQASLFEAGEPLSPGAHSRYGVAARIDLKLPTGPLSRAGGSGGFDAGLGLLGTAELTRWLTAHALFSTSRFSHLSCGCALQPAEWHWAFEASLAASLGATTFLVEDRVVSPLLDSGWSRVAWHGNDGILASGLYAGFRPHNQVTFAIRYGRFTLWLSEDATPGSNDVSTLPFLYMSNAPDVVVGLSFSQPL